MRKFSLLLVIGLSFIALSCGQMHLPYFIGVSVDDQFTRFPVDLDKLFYDDDPTYYANYLQTLTSGTMLISPFSRHVSGSHPEGYGKWYLRSSERAIKVYLPIRAVLFPSRINFSDVTAETIVTYDGNRVLVDMDVDWQVNPDVWINLDHMDMLVSIRDDLNNSEDGYLVLPAGTHVGYILPSNYNSSATTGTMDFQVVDYRVNQGIAEDPNYHANRWSYPLTYFDTDVRTDLTNRYADLYDRLEELGRAPESKLDSPLDINVANSPWGVWYYQSGDLSGGSSYHFFLGIIAWLKHPEKTNSETFLYDPRNTTQEVSIPSDFAGFFGYSGSSPPTQYSFLESYANWSMFYVSGSGSETFGVYRLDKNLTTSYYLKFEFIENSSSKWDDQLKIEFFDTFSEATGSFVSPLMYGRNPEE